MDTNYINLSYVQVGLAALLITFNGVISLLLGLGLGRQLTVASARMTVQLLLIGFILNWVFSINKWHLVLLLVLIMTLIAGVTSVERTELRYKGIWTSSVISVWSSSWVVTAIGIFIIINVEPWYRPQYLIPLVGMILGNTLNGISLGLDRFLSLLEEKRDGIETKLALGATSWEAAQSIIREAVRTGMIPILNVMMVAGIVSLPGMMTGQLLAGIEPIQAVKYQLVIMFMIASCTALGTVGSVLLSYRALFNESHQFLRDSLSTTADKDNVSIFSLFRKQ